MRYQEKPIAIFEYQAGGVGEGSPDQNARLECIRDHRLTPSGNHEFLIHWRGTPTSDDYWEVITELQTDWTPML